MKYMCKNHVAKLHIGSKTIYFWIWNFKVVAKLLYYIVFHLDLVIATRKSFDVTSMYKSLFHRKYAVAAANNLSVHAFSSIGNTSKNVCGTMS